MFLLIRRRAFLKEVVGLVKRLSEIRGISASVSAGSLKRLKTLCDHLLRVSDGRAEPGRIASHTGPRQTRRSPPLPATRSAADKSDTPATRPDPCARSTNPLASPAACVSPSPCADSTNRPCASLNNLRLTNQHLHDELVVTALCLILGIVVLLRAENRCF